MSVGATSASDSVATDKPQISATPLAESLMLLAVLTVVQRLVGFLRGVLFCRWLSPEQLGQWDLLFGFLMLAGPLVVLGVPGTFGRYVEYYNQRQQLKTFLKRTGVVSLVLTILGCSVLIIWDRQAAMVLFNESTSYQTMVAAAITLASVVGFNYLVELFIGMRQMRVVSVLQFVNSLIFAIVGLGLIQFWAPTSMSVIISYGIACAATCILGAYFLTNKYRLLPPETEISTHREFWAKLAPFAAWMWIANLLSNLFLVIDRYMIVHFGGFTPEQAAAEVANYHSSRVVPWLMASVAGLVIGVLLPHLSADWEAGRRREVGESSNLIVKLGSLVFTGGGVMILLAAPWLFGVVFSGKYDGGLAVLPWTVASCAWSSIGGLTLLYLYCAEKAKLVSLLYAVGLTFNICLNFLLLPRLGLEGAVLATAVSNGITFCVGLSLCRRLGMEVDSATWMAVLLPLTLGFGLMIAAPIWIVCVWQAACGRSILSNNEKLKIAEGLGKLRNRYAGRNQPAPRGDAL
ncbi:oligosaccharide flippase family protein [Blastopirellula sp. JC732]|uniref:Oligosaccharide flippase family protein n=1 Tax=Blastopirellula sediminis TaxID=2894196 RepID=A0A9X1MPY4_9BACT|nr:oligosaccharide flippase family protein [Blastopirellula sediminis]MCC9605407.1 oligosaccharide flippase family protein [Blastopirellula sediminis]MCC9631293.1 oligosaccharide flippase family protein [Blastopirellula sediminis]